MTLIQTPPQNPPSFLSQVTTFLLVLIKSSPKAQFKTVIDLKGPNQAVDEHRRGLVPMFLHKRNAYSDPHSRKNLLKKRYFQILQEQGSKKIEKQKQSHKKTTTRSQNTKIKDLQNQIRIVNTLMISTKRSIIFQPDFLQPSPQLHVSFDKKVQAKKKNEKTDEMKQQMDGKEGIKYIQEEKQAKDKIPQIQTPEKTHDNNPFLISTTKKLSFSDLITGTLTKKKQYQQIPIPEQSEKEITQMETTAKSKNNYFRENSFIQQTSKQNQTFPAHNPPITSKTLNMFSNMQNQLNFPQNSISDSQTFMPTSYQDSASLFMAQPSQNTLFIDPPNNQSRGGKERGRKKKGAARVYQN